MIVAVDCLRPQDPLDAVLFDHAGAINLAVDHLVELGHRRIGYLGTCTREPVPHNVVRREAFVARMQHHGLPVDERWVFSEQHVYDEVPRSGAHCDIAGRMAAEHIMALDDHRPTAAVAYNDLVASSTLRGLIERRLHVPRDFSLVNVEDTAIARHLMPRLTSVHHPLRDMGYAAAEHLIERAEARGGGRSDQKQNSQPLRVCLPPDITVRESSGPCPRQHRPETERK